MNSSTIETTNKPAAVNFSAPDLTRHPPRSPRVRLGGYAILPRCLDKGRATIAGTNGEYNFACPLDRQFLDFVGIDPEKLRVQLAARKSDNEILTWVEANAAQRKSPDEIETWVRQQERRGPNAELKTFFEDTKKTVAPSRTDIESWFELLDADDYVSFGGRS